MIIGVCHYTTQLKDARNAENTYGKNKNQTPIKG